ncbi:uncharacterized protein FFB20_01934 [Fusarium fujikuroi]|uniref:Uncharacterized protein n=1 Tax=Gibberella fujikuroi (strain CBS 195.34 / IMI 58289 / NRRL A-6831) TaxID=1279085 RepID=S0EN40_GIBF5|nr:uncharacterized protein FFUJ_09301 [Fusarium fujikuroi IMI 58289]KLO95290.1 uncharacterized protein Y057_12710 [Fusarium fujikuroi]KLP14160.1 uncharacterized protein LW94_11083 [Fusarium fujikuroi]CCT73873.1 uncharacterized protein FFUJ_09301 [Fusarium fujikuroi IMI 58289]SCN65783.1 uncharacterized protein FFB20_01934 [Fusarium fujikuroi]SCO02057.1 uncharacterized protein FFC1_09093 [Fusarium fujikuroi]
MQCKSKPFTFNHADISTPDINEVMWSTILDQHQSRADPMFANLVVVGNAFSSLNHQAEADRRMLINNDNEKLKSLQQHHPEHLVFLTTKHKSKIGRHQKYANMSQRGTSIESRLGVDPIRLSGNWTAFVVIR